MLPGVAHNSHALTGGSTGALPGARCQVASNRAKQVLLVPYQLFLGPPSDCQHNRGALVLAGAADASSSAPVPVRRGRKPAIRCIPAPAAPVSAALNSPASTNAGLSHAIVQTACSEHGIASDLQSPNQPVASISIPPVNNLSAELTGTKAAPRRYKRPTLQRYATQQKAALSPVVRAETVTTSEDTSVQVSGQASSGVVISDGPDATAVRSPVASSLAGDRQLNVCGPSATGELGRVSNTTSLAALSPEPLACKPLATEKLGLEERSLSHETAGCSAVEPATPSSKTSPAQRRRARQRLPHLLSSFWLGRVLQSSGSSWLGLMPSATINAESLAVAPADPPSSSVPDPDIGLLDARSLRAGVDFAKLQSWQELNADGTRPVLLCFKQMQGYGYNVYEVPDLGFGLCDDVFNKLMQQDPCQQPRFVGTVPPELQLVFPASAQSSHGATAWYSFSILREGEYHHEDHQTQWPNRVLHEDRTVWNARNYLDLAVWLAVPSYDRIRSHLNNLSLFKTSAGNYLSPEHCLRQLVRVWGKRAVQKLGFTRRHVLAVTTITRRASGIEHVAADMYDDELQPAR